MTFTVRAKVWRYPGAGGWHFLTVSRAASNAIKSMPRRRKIGWGSVPIRATIGGAEWRTSLFPGKDGRYLLPVKAAVRASQGLGDGSTVRVILRLQ